MDHCYNGNITIPCVVLVYFLLRCDTKSNVSDTQWVTNSQKEFTSLVYKPFCYRRYPLVFSLTTANLRNQISCSRISREDFLYFFFFEFLNSSKNNFLLSFTDLRQSQLKTAQYENGNYLWDIIWLKHYLFIYLFVWKNVKKMLFK